MTKRLIEEWLPIKELGIESLRERTPMTPYPAPNRLHVWWARRPLVASRAAIMASLLPADTDRSSFLRLLGIHGDPVNSKKRIDDAKRKGKRFEGQAYDYKRAFTYSLTTKEESWFKNELKKIKIIDPVILDPTSGGGAIPFEGLRLGCNVFSNDLNPVAVLTQKATYEFPLLYGNSLLDEFQRLSKDLVHRREEKIRSYYPPESEKNCISTNYLWARTLVCPYCEGKIPLSPNWKLAANGTGVKINPQLGKGPGDKNRVCEFEIVNNISSHSSGTVKGGSATCVFPDCGRVVDSEQIKEQAKSTGLGDQLYAVVFKKLIITGYTKASKRKPSRPKTKWERAYRAAVPSDNIHDDISSALKEKLPEWEALDVIPTERFPEICNDSRPIKYGMPLWRDLFSPRQLFCHGTSVEIFSEMVKEESNKEGGMSDVTAAAFAYISIALDKTRDYNSRMTRWIPNREATANTFDRHDFAFKWSYSEMSPLIAEIGYDWAFKQVEKCISELLELLKPSDSSLILDTPLLESLNSNSQKHNFGFVKISNRSGSSLENIDNDSVDVVVIDPPYYDNVMYAELSDFFYVWLKRTAGLLFPELFIESLTNKEKEAVANPSLHDGKKDSKFLARLDYQQKMSEIFQECRRVLKDDGCMTLMFTHKATGAWDALTKSLIDSGFIITASWPINTEAEGSLHIKDKSAANSTIFLVCRLREQRLINNDVKYWEDLEPLVKSAVRQRIEQFQLSGIRGVDIYLSSFGPALEEFSRHWPIKRGQPKKVEKDTKNKQNSQLKLETLFLDEDPYSVSPEDALEAARREVKAWRMEKLTSRERRTQLDALSEWFVLAWDAFGAPQFPFDEALRLARVVGLDIDKEVVGVLAEKKNSDLILWDSSTRAQNGKLGPPDGTGSWIDTIHHCAHRARSIDLNAAKQLVEDNGYANNPNFLTVLEAVLEVLPISARFCGFDPVKAAAPSASDFDVLENLRRLVFIDKLSPPKQLKLVLDEE